MEESEEVFGRPEDNSMTPLVTRALENSTTRYTSEGITGLTLVQQASQSTGRLENRQREKEVFFSVFQFFSLVVYAIESKI